MGKFGNAIGEVGTRLTPTLKTENSDGFDALGKPVPMYRRAVAYEHLKQMGCTDKDKMFSCIEAMCIHIERDEPHAALERALLWKDNPEGIVDATGSYRLLAVLLSANNPKQNMVNSDA